MGALQSGVTWNLCALCGACEANILLQQASEGMEHIDRLPERRICLHIACCEHYPRVSHELYQSLCCGQESHQDGLEI